MRSLARLRSFLRALIGRRRLERDMDAELSFHVASRTQDLVDGGLRRDLAEKQARQELGNAGLWKEQGREARGLRLTDDLMADVRYGLRWLRRFPTFALSAILSIAIGVGATTAMFTMANALLLRLLPTSDPQSLVLFSRSDVGDALGSSFPYPFCRELQTTETPLASVTCRAGLGPQVAEVDGPAEMVSAELVAGTFLEMLGAKPFLGRLLTRADNETPGGHPVVVLSHGYWQRRFGGDPTAVGRTVRVNSVAMTIVGVTAPGFVGVELGFSPDVRLPLMIGAPPARLNSRADWWLDIVGRLKPGVTRDVALADLDAQYQAFLSPGQPVHRLDLLPASQGIRRLQTRFEAPVVLLNVLGGILLTLVCLNVANLTMARAAGRAREFSVRRALGARESRIVTQLVVESGIIAMAGGALALLIAPGLARALATMVIPSTTAALFDFGVDFRVFGFASTLSVLVATICGVAPALTLRRMGTATALAVDSHRTVGGRVLARRILVSAQVALSFALLVGAGLLTQTLLNLRGTDLGFRGDGLTLVTLRPRADSAPAERLQFFADLEARATSLPGVEGASLAMMPLLGRGEWSSGLTLDTGERDPKPAPQRNAVGPKFFSTVGMSLVSGREFSTDDDARAPKVAIVNESFAKRYLRDRVLGRRIGIGGAKGVAEWTVVGVVADANRAFVREQPAPVWYVPYRQLANVDSLVLHARSVLPADAAASEIRDLVASLDRRVPIAGVISMKEQIDRQLVSERLLAGLSGAFGLFAIALAGIGLYGVTDYMTLARTREIGLRLALGSTRARILTLVLRQTAILLGLGLTAGLLLVMMSTSGLESLLFGISPLDATVIGSAAALVLAVTVLAAWLPARRAVRVSPTTLLR